MRSSPESRPTGPLSAAALLDEGERRHALRPGDGVQLMEARELLRRPFDPGIALIVMPASESGAPASADPTTGGEAFVPPVLPGRAGHGGSAATLLQRLYPAGHPVLVLDDGPARSIGDLDDGSLARGGLLVPALPAAQDLGSPHGLPWLVARLRAPDGCPWDREQTHLTLRNYLLEEAYEVYDALDEGSTPALAEELGDLLLQIVLHAQYGAEAGVFDLADVQRAVMTKIIRRHPHVFGDVEARSVEQVLRNWERIKADERSERALDAGAAASSARPGPEEMPDAFAGLSRSLPALAYAQEIQERAASLGYDWPDVAGVVAKVQEEVAELTAATDSAERREELGDLLLVIVNLARHLGLDAEAALRGASRKFAGRFARVERLAETRGVELRELDLDALDELWDAAKVEERGTVSQR